METIRERISGYPTIQWMELYMMLVIFDQSEGERQSKVVLNYCDPAIICITLCLKAANLKLIIDNTREKITASPGDGNTPVVSWIEGKPPSLSLLIDGASAWVFGQNIWKSIEFQLVTDGVLCGEAEDPSYIRGK